MNAKDMLDQLRDNIAEATASYWSDVNLVRRLNIAQRKVALAVAMAPGQWLIKSASVTPSSSVITLPADCSKPIYLEETSSGVPVEWLSGGVAYRRISRSVGTTLDVGSTEAYPLLNTLEVNRDSYSEACTLWYQIRVPDLHAGTAATGTGANALVFAADRNRSFVDDYYNNVTVEIIDQTSAIVDVRSTISDYVASTGTATIVGTGAASDTYGTVSRLPEEVHSLILAEATVSALMKPDAQLDKDVLSWYRAEVKDLRRDVEEWLSTRIIEKTGVAVGDPY